MPHSRLDPTVGHYGIVEPLPPIGWYANAGMSVTARNRYLRERPPASASADPSHYGTRSADGKGPSSFTATFRVFYVFTVLEVGSRRIRHWNVTGHPTATWTAQQFRMVMSGEEPHRFLIHDYDSIYSDSVDQTIAAMGLTILKTPVRSPQANAFCERVIGTIRRECLDWMIPFT